MPFDPFGYGKSLRAISGQVSQLFSFVQTLGAQLMSGLTDIQAQVSSLQANVSNLTAAINTATAAIDNEVAVLQNPSSDDAALEAAAQSISTQNEAIQAASAALAQESAKLPPVSQIPNPAPEPTRAPASDAAQSDSPSSTGIASASDEKTVERASSNKDGQRTS